MKCALRYEADAVDDLDRIVDYGVLQGYDDPETYVETLIKRLESLREHPQAGRPGRVAGTRELVLGGTPYVVIYCVDSDGAQHAPRLLFSFSHWEKVARSAG